MIKRLIRRKRSRQEMSLKFRSRLGTFHTSSVGARVRNGRARATFSADETRSRKRRETTAGGHPPDSVIRTTVVQEAVVLLWIAVTETASRGRSDTRVRGEIVRRTRVIRNRTGLRSEKLVSVHASRTACLPRVAGAEAAVPVATGRATRPRRWSTATVTCRGAASGPAATSPRRAPGRDRLARRSVGVRGRSRRRRAHRTAGAQPSVVGLRRTRDRPARAVGQTWSIARDV